MILYWLIAFLFKAFARIFLRLKVEGLGNLPKEKNFILAANHASSLDPFVIIAAMPRHIRWVIVYEYFDLWYFRWLLKQMRFIRVGNSLSKEAFSALLQGEVIGIFPEGRRTWNGHLGRARRGMVALARRTSCPVVPVAIQGTFTALPRTRKWLKLSPVTVRIGQPLFFPAQESKDAQQLDQQNSQRIMESIANLLQDNAR